MDFVLENATVLAGESRLDHGCVAVKDGRIAHVGPSGSLKAAPPKHVDLGGRRLVPGFVDLQVNGGGGALFNAAPTLETLRTIADAHARFGTTSLLPTLISDDLSVMRAAIQAVRLAIDEAVPGILGIHIEGPFISPHRKGAHDGRKLRRIDDQAAGILTSLGRDAVTLVTIAPELTSPARVSELASAGVLVFAGHTAASYEDCVAAEKAGLSGYTHLFNGMAPFQGSDPGVVGAAIDSPTAVFGIIADGHHVHPASLRLACNAKYRGGALLVTDAMPTVGSTESGFELYGERIERVDGVLRNAAGSLAGSDLTMVAAVRNCMDFCGYDWMEAVRMASAYPARVAGREGEIGSIRVGAVADLVELTDDMEIHRVWRRGEEFHTR